MKQYLLPQGGKFYKANLHMHTNVSDGNMTPEETKRAYVEQGYSIVAFTDHEIIVPHNELTDDSFLAITSCELSVTESRPQLPFSCKKTYHLNFLSKDSEKVVFSTFSADHVHYVNAKSFITDEMKQYDYRHVYSVECINDIIARSNAEGFLVSYNHPVWSEQDYTDYAPLKGLWGVELYNTGCVNSGYPDTPQPLDDLLRQGERVFPLATDDAHHYGSCFGGWVMVKAERLEYDAVMKALEHGEFYSSSGPEIYELFIEDGVLHVRTSDAVQIFYSTERRATGAVCAEKGKTVCEAAFNLDWYLKENETLASQDALGEPYIRVTVKDQQGNCAWTRAYFLDELNL
ncbi:MAG: PHP domain-containing protein [Clostridia bacterium]|nr:PHP domain-containing protein [Clostridia bacterium]